jgi:MtrB/PioB family decaheme-associated outer membrane protein
MTGLPQRRIGNGLALLALAGLCGAPLRASADTQLGSLVASGELEAGTQIIAGDTDSAQFDQYRDVRTWIARLRFLIDNPDSGYYLRGSFADWFQDDESYTLEGGRWGRWGISAEFSELPHNTSDNGASPYFGVRGDDLTLPFARPPVPDLETAVNATLRSQDLGVRLLTAGGGAFYRINPELEVSADYRLLDREGTYFLGGLSSRFTNFALFPAPVDSKIHEVTTGLKWSRDRYSANLSYTGNFYQDDLGTSASVDNPLVGSDTATASSRWRYAVPPDNASHTFSLTGAAGLPTGFPARLAATFSYGLRLQDEDIVPQTINSALAGDPLLEPSRNDIDGKVQTFLGNLVLTTQPLEDLSLDFRYRIYDYDNDSDVVALMATVTSDVRFGDAVPGEFDRYSVPNEYQRQNAGVDASYRLSPLATLGFGWEWERWERSSGREVEHTDEQGPELTLDVRPASWAEIHASYAFTTRRRSSYDPFAYVEESFNPAEVPAASGAIFSELRNFPLADRRLHEATLIAQFRPLEQLDLGVSGGMSYADYHRSDYGLESDERWWAGFDASYRPSDWLELSGYYSYEQGLLRQRSRQRPGDETDDWNTRSPDRAHTAGLEALVRLIPDRLDLILDYTYQNARAPTHSGGPNPGAVNYPTIDNSLSLLAAALQYRIDEHLSIKTQYRLERYRQSDFQFDGIAPVTPALGANNLYLGNSVSDYRAHIYALSLLYEF